ncbi:MAG TPA: ribonuclease P protein component [Candidatus Saccharimonadales bacterium]|nr:ribonuclease P protein component [Candidatus Saccharimonadales bacterium]
MISRTHRFHGRASLNYVYRQGKTVHLPEASLKFILNQRRQTYRTAVVVSKKVNKSAVARNRIRRRLYEVIRRHNTTKPYDLIITVFADDIAAWPTEQVNNFVDRLFKQAGIN